MTKQTAVPEPKHDEAVPARRAIVEPWFGNGQPNDQFNGFIALDAATVIGPAYFKYEVAFIVPEDVPNFKRIVQSAFGIHSDTWQYPTVSLLVDEQLIVAVPISGGWLEL